MVKKPEVNGKLHDSRAQGLFDPVVNVLEHIRSHSDPDIRLFGGTETTVDPYHGKLLLFFHRFFWLGQSLKNVVRFIMSNFHEN